MLSNIICLQQQGLFCWCPHLTPLQPVFLAAVGIWGYAHSAGTAWLWCPTQRSSTGRLCRTAAPVLLWPVLLGFVGLG